MGGGDQSVSHRDPNLGHRCAVPVQGCGTARRTSRLLTGSSHSIVGAVSRKSRLSGHGA